MKKIFLLGFLFIGLGNLNGIYNVLNKNFLTKNSLNINVNLAENFVKKESRFCKSSTVVITYDPKLTSYKKLLNVFWKNIDPFDAAGQFCDKGESYRSVTFYKNKMQKNYIEKTIYMM